MNVKLEKKEKSQIVLEFTMPKEDFSKALDKAFIKNAKFFKVPGFRNGKVPRNVVEKMYGENVLYETVIEDTVDEEYAKAVETNNLEIVSKPELNVKQIGKDKDLIYTVTVCVKPEAKVSKYKELEIKKVDTKVSKKDLDEALEEARSKNARIISIEDRALINGDISTINFKGFVDNTAFEGGQADNFELTIGSGQFIPGFEEQLIGMKIGEKKDITVKFPEDYHAENLAGKDAIFNVDLLSIKAKVLPELDDEFAKDISEFETLEEYKKDLKLKVAAHKEEHAKTEKETLTIDKLIENVEVEIPEGMINSEIDQMMEQFTSNLSYQGLTIEKYCEYVGTTVDEFRKTMIPNAARDVKLKLALEFISKAENVQIEDNEIDKKIDELVAQYGNEGVSDLKKNENARNYMKEKLLQEKTLAIVVDSVVEK
ncbi:MAG: trigger factor [Clostridia bacterium]